MIYQLAERFGNFRKGKFKFETIDNLEFKSIKLVYHSPDESHLPQKMIFDDLSFKFKLDDNYLLEGSMGSGRSSMMKILAGLLIPGGGSYFINDHDILQMSFEEFLPYRLRIGYSFDYSGLLANRTLKDNLLIPLLYHKLMTEHEAQKRVHYLLDVFKITGHENQRPASVSGAMRKATVVARSFIAHPEMLILDDPFVGLDDEQGKNIVDLIGEQRHLYGLRHVFYSTRYDRFVKLLGGKSITVQNSKITINEELKRPA